MNSNSNVILQQVSVEDLMSQFRAIVKSEIASIPSAPKADKPFLTIDETSELTGLAKQTIYSKTSAGTMPHIKRGGKLLFDRSEIISWLRQATQPVAS